MATSYYIYYRVAASDGERLQAIVTRMHAGLEASTGIAGRLLRRCDDAQTWMEIYEDVQDTAQFEGALADAVTHHKLEALLQSTRVVERFVPVEPIDPGPAHTTGKTVR
jgi:hypothetical protein